MSTLWVAWYTRAGLATSQSHAVDGWGATRTACGLSVEGRRVYTERALGTAYSGVEVPARCRRCERRLEAMEVAA